MAAQPYYTAPYVPHLLEHNAIIEGAAQTYLEERHLSCEDGCYYDDQNLTPLHYGYSYHIDDLRCAVPALPSQDRILYPPLQHRYADLDLLELGRHGHFQEPGPPPHDAADEELEFGGRGRRRYRDSLPRDAANEKLLFGRRGHCPNRDPLLYDVADVRLEYGLRGRFPNRISPPYDTAKDGFLSDDERRGRVYRHSFGNHGLAFPSGDTGIDDFDVGSFRQIYLGPHNPHSRSRLRGHHDLGSDHLGSLDPHLRRCLEPRLDDYTSDLDIAVRGLHYGVGRAGMPPAGRYSTEHPFKPELNYASETIFPEAYARRPLRPRPTGQRSDLGFRSVHEGVEDESTRGVRTPTAAESISPSYHAQKHDGLNPEDRSQGPRKSLNEVAYPGGETEIEHLRPAHRDRPRQRSRAARPRPAARLSDNDLEGSPRGRRDLPFRPRHSRSRPHSPRIKRTRPPVAADHTAQGAASNTPRAQQHIQGPVDHAKHKHTARNDSAGSINASDKPGITPLPERVARKTSCIIAHTSQAGPGNNDGYDSSSDSGCDTPDDDSDVAVGADDDVQEGDVLQTFVQIEL